MVILNSSPRPSTFVVSDAPPPIGVFAGSGCRLRCPVPRHQVVDAFLWPAIHQACQQIGEVGLWIDAIQLAGLDERRQAGPVFAAFITTRKEAIFSRKTNWPHSSLNTVVVCA